MSNAEIVRKTEAPMAPVNPASVGEILRLAVDKGASIEQMRGILDLQERIEKRAAEADFRASFARFQGECPPIKHDQVVDFVTKAGRRTSYSHASLGQIARTINPILGRYGLSYSWESANVDGMMVVTCLVSHVSGHNVSAKFGLPAKGGTDSMSEAQQYASTLTYAKRQSLVQALGLTTADSDVDGADMAHVVTAASGGDRITEDQAANLRALAEDVGADRERFLKFFGIASLADMPAARLPEAIKMLEGKRK